ncbi:MAG TPA: hypothetical protein VF765_34765 [Polyangiaceae bacterium]
MSAFADSASATVGTALIPPTYAPAQACSFSTSAFPGGAPTMVAPIPLSSSYALGGSGGGTLHPLSSYPVYIIFAGPDWTTDHTSTGPLTTVAQAMLSNAQSILGSSYASGVAQYGSIGSVFYGGYYVDACTNPLNTSWTIPPPSLSWYETNRAITVHSDCPNPNQAAWAAAAGTSDASNSAIFVQVHYWAGDHGTFLGSYGGSNWFSGKDSLGNVQCAIGSCQNSWLSTPVNTFDISLEYPDVAGDAGAFSWVLSHELVERMSTGTAAQTAQCGLPNTQTQQIADGEPENSGYTLALNSGSAPVTAYWSVMDQAFIAPGAVNVPNSDSDIDARVFMPIVPNLAGVSLRKQTLSTFQLADGTAPTGETVATQVQTYAFDAQNNLYDLTAGVANKFTGTPTSPSWTAITGANMVAQQLVAPHAPDPCTFAGLVGGGVYVASELNGSVPQVFQYSGSGTSWNTLSTNMYLQSNGLVGVTNSKCNGGSPTTTTSIYILARQGSASNPLYVWQWAGGQSWSQLIGSNTAATTIATANENLYMLASNGGNYQVWQYLGSGTNWQPITPSTWSVQQMWVAGDVLMATALPQGGHYQIWEYVPPADGSPGSSSNWTATTGTNTTFETTANVIQDGIEVFTLANNGSGNEVFEFQGIASQTNPTLGWLALNDSTYSPQAIRLSTADVLQMEVPVGRFFSWLTYGGSPNSWH